MKYIIKRTTVTLGQENIYYFMKMTAMGPMFQSRNLAKEFDTKEEALTYISDNLSKLEGTIEIIQIDEK